MPIHVPPLNRRDFLRGSLVSGAVATLGGLAPRLQAESDESEANRFALLADTHIPSDAETTARGTNMTSNLQQVVSELTGAARKPAAAIVNGDCAYLKGLPQDYANLAGLVQPLRAAGIPIHFTMGNHDDRQPFHEALKSQPGPAPVQTKHVGILESPHANWFLLDSLLVVNKVTGQLGEEQLSWIDRELTRRSDKPALMVAHHNPQFQPPKENGVWTGLQDSERLFQILDRHPHVKAYFYGHTHHWSIQQRGDIHLVNLPPVAYIFTEGKPNGWVECTLSQSSMQLTLHALDKQHPQHGQSTDLAWR